MRTAAWIGLLGALVAACGGKLAALDDEDGSTDGSGPVSFDAAVLDGASHEGATDAGVADAGPDVVSAVECIPTASNPLGCQAHDCCVLWIDTDAAATSTHSDSFADDFPDADIVRSACMPVGSVATACDGGAPLGLAFSNYANQVAWVVCREP